jgi:hypothetical protein
MNAYSLVDVEKYDNERQISIGQIARRRLCMNILELSLVGTSAYILLYLILAFASSD